ncbi:unnamed protein product [Calicophoron daubneyi]|uniref:Uncharacterized protein n=1 Tax=Calicophoron daubneyi TaxID=300641 RepID=A0AAV2SZ98_CALDB
MMMGDVFSASNVALECDPGNGSEFILGGYYWATSVYTHPLFIRARNRAPGLTSTQAGLGQMHASPVTVTFARAPPGTPFVVVAPGKQQSDHCKPTHGMRRPSTSKVRASRVDIEHGNTPCRDLPGDPGDEHSRVHTAKTLASIPNGFLHLSPFEPPTTTCTRSVQTWPPHPPFSDFSPSSAEPPGSWYTVTAACNFLTWRIYHPYMDVYKMPGPAQQTTGS